MRYWQVVTILKNTAKLVTEVPFPALTICSSGLHKKNAEKKLIQDFDDWRAEKNKKETTKEAIYKDAEEFMETRFQIKPNNGNDSDRENPTSILDILDTMIAPDVDASFAANSVRKNAFACKQSIQPTEDNSGCSYSCQDSKFSISGINCFYMSTTTETQAMAVSRCERIGA